MTLKLLGIYWEGEEEKGNTQNESVQFTHHAPLPEPWNFHIINLQVYVEIRMTCQKLKAFSLCFSGFMTDF